MADTPSSSAALRYQPPWLWIVVSLAGYLETRIPPHIWPDNVLLVLSAVLAVAVVVHAACWFAAWLLLRYRRSTDA